MLGLTSSNLILKRCITRESMQFFTPPATDVCCAVRLSVTLFAVSSLFRFLLRRLSERNKTFLPTCSGLFVVHVDIY